MILCAMRGMKPLVTSLDRNAVALTKSTRNFAVVKVRGRSCSEKKLSVCWDSSTMYAGDPAALGAGWRKLESYVSCSLLSIGRKPSLGIRHNAKSRKTINRVMLHGLFFKIQACLYFLRLCRKKLCKISLHSFSQTPPMVQNL